MLESDFGITLPRWLQIAFSKVVQAEAERTGGEVESAHIRRLFDAAYVTVPPGWQVGDYDLRRGGGRVQLTANVGGATLAGEGHGAVEALMDALTHARGVRGVVESFDEFALGSGTGASAMACARVRVGEEVTVGIALAEDTTSATLQALLSAVGRRAPDLRRTNSDSKETMRI